jgi:hypothetical protein
MLVERSLVTFLALAAALVLVDTQTAQARRTRIADVQTVSLTKSLGHGEPGCCTPEPACCPEQCITYRHCGRKLCCGSCKPPKQIVLKVKDPCTCCEVDVPVCLPACCEGEPTVCTGKGFLCRDVVEYEWCCGFYVRVAFKKCGDLIVTTKGR